MRQFIADLPYLERTIIQALGSVVSGTGGGPCCALLHQTLENAYADVAEGIHSCDFDPLPSGELAGWRMACHCCTAGVCSSLNPASTALPELTNALDTCAPLSPFSPCRQHARCHEAFGY